MPEVPEGVLTDLRAIRSTFELRWNERAVLARRGFIDASGTVTPAEYEPRWELWDTDPEGATYRVMTLQTSPGDDPIRFPDGGQFKPPGDWLVHHLRFLNPARFNGDLNQLLHEAIDEPQVLLEIGAEADSDDLIDMVGKWAGWIRRDKEPVLKSLDEIAREHAAWRAERYGLLTPAVPSGPLKGENPCPASS